MIRIKVIFKGIYIAKFRERERERKLNELFDDPIGLKIRLNPKLLHLNNC